MLRNIKIINNDKGNVKHYTKLKILIVLLLLLLVTIIFNSCGSKKIDIHEEDTIVIDDYRVQFLGVSRFQDVIYVTVNIYRPKDHEVIFDPDEDFALLDRGKPLELFNINGQEIEADKYAVRGDMDHHWSFEYKFKDFPEELTFQIKDKKFLKDKIYEYKISNRELSY
ncbi:hypothetical protein ACN5ZK_03575 [Macrococcoides bohemicum]|uniref:hypothetical protein n=1 Tax=Macrococcoides bohemicum TaxID=1903056 RepID=UPI003AFFB23C